MAKTTGEKIRQFRNRANMSQLDLEMSIAAAPGSLSRIESDKVNPTKETLSKIVEVLDLKATEAAELFNIDVAYDLSRFIDISRQVSNQPNFNDMLQFSVNEIVYELGILGAIIFEEKEGWIYSKTFTQTWYTQLVLNIINKPFSQLKVSLTDHTQNLACKCYVTNQVTYLDKLEDLTLGVIGKQTSRMLAKLTNTQSGILFPLVSHDQKIGAMLFTQTFKTKFEREHPILQAFANHVADSIYSAREYEKLIEKVKTKAPD